MRRPASIAEAIATRPPAGLRASTAPSARTGEAASRSRPAAEASPTATTRSLGQTGEDRRRTIATPMVQDAPVPRCGFGTDTLFLVR